MSSKQRVTLIGTALCIFAGIVAGITMVGQAAGLAQVLTVFFSGMGAGATLVSALRKNPSA